MVLTSGRTGQPVEFAGALMKMLDLFCCAGGAGAGYAQAGFEVYGVELDHRRAKHYPFSVHIGDALDVLRRLILGHGVEFVSYPPEALPEVEVMFLDDFDLIHASPPCQAYTRGNAVRRDTQTKWPRLIEPVRDLLRESGLPYVIENVKDAGYALIDPTWLCGCMFGLGTTDDDGVYVHVQRGRWFETSFPLAAPRPCDHTGHEWVAGAYGGARRDKYEAKYVRKGGYVPPNKAVVQRMLGIDHPMTWAELFESIPPAYTKHIGSIAAEVVK
jgi:DNA (cytosine-5)-methyltransferase 1